MSWRKNWQPTPVFLPGEAHGQRSLAGYSPWGRKESDTTEHTCAWDPKVGSERLWRRSQLSRWDKRKNKQVGKGTPEEEMVGWYHQLKRREFEQT